MQWTFPELTEAYLDLLSDNRDLRANYDTWDDLYYMRYKNGLEGTNNQPGAYDHIFKPATALRMVEAPVNFMAMDSIKVGQPTLLRGENATMKEGDQGRADKVGAFAQAVVSGWADLPPYFLRDNIKDLVWFGNAFYLVLPKPEVLKGKDYSGPPFTIEAVNPRPILAPLDGDSMGCPSMLFRESLLRYSQLLKLNEEWNGTDVLPVFKKDLPKREKVLLLEWWTPEERGYMAHPQASLIAEDWALVKYDAEDRVKNPFEFIPFTRGFFGYGRMPVDGKPDKIALGLLAGQKDVIVQESRNYTRTDTMAAFLTYPRDKYTLPPNMDKLPEHLTNLPPGKPIVLTGGITHEEGQMRQIPPALLQMHQEIKEQLEWVLPGVIRGVPQPGEPSSGLSLRLMQTTSAWQGPNMSSKQMIGNALGMMLKIIDKLDLKVEAGGIKIGKEDIQGNYAVTVRIQSGNPEEQLRKQEQGKGLKGILGTAHILEEYMGVDNATNERIEVASDNLVESILTNLNMPLAQPIAAMIAEGLNLRLQDEGLIPLKPPAPNTQTGNPLAQVRPSEGNPAVNGNLTTGLVPTASARGPLS